MLVSRNTRDFAYEDKGALHPVLAEEAESVEGIVRYFNGLDAFIDHVASKTDPPELDVGEVCGLFDLDLRTALEELGDTPAGVDKDKVALADITISDLRVLRSYEVDGRGLSLIEGRAALTDPDDGEPFPHRQASFLAWMEFDTSTFEPVAADLQKVTLST